MKETSEVSADTTYSPRNLVISGIIGFSTVLLSITGYFAYTVWSNLRHPLYAQPETRDMAFITLWCLLGYGLGTFITFQCRRLLTEYIPAWIFTSFLGSAVLLFPLNGFVYFEMRNGSYQGCGNYSSDPQNWQVFLTALLISLMLFCIASISSGTVSYFLQRRGAVLGLR